MRQIPSIAMSQPRDCATPGRASERICSYIGVVCGHIDFFRSNRTSQNSTAAKSCSSNMNNNSNNNNNIDNNDNSKRSGGRPSNSRRRAEISDDLISSLSERWTQLTDIVLTTHMK